MGTGRSTRTSRLASETEFFHKRSVPVSGWSSVAPEGDSHVFRDPARPSSAIERHKRSLSLCDRVASNRKIVGKDDGSTP